MGMGRGRFGVVVCEDFFCPVLDFCSGDVWKIDGKEG
jgi:hypothetical protein